MLWCQVCQDLRILLQQWKTVVGDWRLACQPRVAAALNINVHHMRRGKNVEKSCLYATVLIH